MGKSKVLGYTSAVLHQCRAAPVPCCTSAVLHQCSGDKIHLQNAMNIISQV
jgi:hypothetical protein